MEVHVFKKNEQERPKAMVGLDAEKLGFKLAMHLVLGSPKTSRRAAQ